MIDEVAIWNVIGYNKKALIPSAWYLYQCKAEEGSDAVASLTDDNVSMMQIASDWYMRN